MGVAVIPDGDTSHDDVLDGQGEGPRGQGDHHHRAAGSNHLGEDREGGGGRGGVFIR